MLNLKLGLSALGLELSAWSTLILLQERSDGALLSYLLLHAAASVALSLTLLPLLPKRLASPRWAALLLMVACSYAVPVAGFLGVVAAFVVLRLYRRAKVVLLLFSRSQHRTWRLPHWHSCNGTDQVLHGKRMFQQ